MKIIGFFTLVYISLITQAVALEYGHCEPNLSSKKYIKNDFSAPYPKEVIFSCDYSCFDGKKHHSVKGITKIKVMDLSHDAKGVVCAGVKVKKASWGWKFDRVDPFYVYTSSIPELRTWAEKNISRNNSQEQKLLEDLKSVIMDVSLTYIQVGKPGFEYFRDAGLKLYKIGMELPESTNTLDLEIKKILDRGRENIPSRQTAEGVLHGFLSTQAFFRFP